MDDKVVEEIRMHQETIATDANTPLHLIREKELEISGQVLSAKRQADEIITEARKKAAEVVSIAEAEGGAGAADRDAAISAKADEDAAKLRSDAQAEADRIKAQVDTRRDEAVRLVLDAVTVA
ncbi:MAG TPA: V-type ATPase subunit subunit G family protein [Coriobacteriia bacterium]